MITWVTVWVLTVSHNQVGTGLHQSYGSGYSYQLQYKDQATCLKEAKKHERRVIQSNQWLKDDTVINRYKSARCDFQQIPLVTK